MKYKHEIVRDIAQKHGYLIKSLDELYDHILEYFITEVRNGEEFYFKGLGKITMQKHKGKRMYDINTGEMREVPARYVPTFVISNSLRVDGTKYADEYEAKMYEEE